MAGLKPLSAERADEALAFCQDSPTEAVHIAGWLAEGSLAGTGPGPNGRGWLFTDDGPSGAIRALALVTSVGILHPLGRSLGLLDGLCGLFRANPRLLRVLVGPTATVDALWERLTTLGLQARSFRNQRLLVAERRSFRPCHGARFLVPAGRPDLDAVIETSAAMAREESKEDPMRRNPQLFRARIAARINLEHDFVHREANELVFKCNVSALSSIGGQIEGIYTAPAFRRRGHGRAGTSWITQWVLERAERSVLLVNEDNLVARRMYSELGYQDVHASRTIFIGP
jgi:ribosomal protein S18 acetylase RimI-like enzyme